MRILVASDHYPPFIGGGHRWAAVMAEGLAGRGHTVTVAAPWSGGQPMAEESTGVTVRRIRQLRTVHPALVPDETQRHQPPFADPVSVQDLRTVIADAEPEVVLAHGWIGFSLIRALPDARTPVLLAAHDYGYFCPNRMLLQNGAVCSGPAPAKCVMCAKDFYGLPKAAVTKIGVSVSRRRLARRISGLQSVTRYVAEAHERFFLSESSDLTPRRYLIPPPILVDPDGQGADEATIASFVEKLPRDPFILFVGAFRRFKGIEILFEAYGNLRNPPPLVMLGTYEHDSPQNFPGGVTVITDVPHRAVMAAWDRCMLGVLPSLGPEPLGMVVVEGMSCGKPVIGTFPGGTVDALEGGAGVLVSKGDAEALRREMQALIDDPQLREHIGRVAREGAQRFALDHVLDETERALQQLIDAPPAAPG